MLDRYSFILGCATLGVGLVIASLVVAGAIKNKSQVGRYQFHPSSPPGVIWRIDTTTGVVKAGSEGGPFDTKLKLQ